MDYQCYSLICMGYYVILADLKTASDLEKECQAFMRATVPRYNAFRWATIETSQKSATSVFYIDDRVVPVLSAYVLSTKVEKITDSDFKSVADKAKLDTKPVISNPSPTWDPIKPDYTKQVPVLWRIPTRLAPPSAPKDFKSAFSKLSKSLVGLISGILLIR